MPGCDDARLKVKPILVSMLPFNRRLPKLRQVVVAPGNTKLCGALPGQPQLRVTDGSQTLLQLPLPTCEPGT